MQIVIDFLSFNTFITQYVLIFFYYLGVVLIPLILHKYRVKISSIAKIDTQNIALKLSVFVLLLIMMELTLRMFFEAMIGYFDIHDYVQIIKSSVS